MLYNPNWKPKTEVDAVGDLMLRAADYLETHRWGQGNIVLANGAVCMIGSLIKVETGKVHSDMGYDWIRQPLTAKAVERISNYLGDDILPEYWNDQDHRKKIEVITVLREAAKR